MALIAFLLLPLPLPTDFFNRFIQLFDLARIAVAAIVAASPFRFRLNRRLSRVHALGNVVVFVASDVAYSSPHFLCSQFNPVLPTHQQAPQITLVVTRFHQ